MQAHRIVLDLKEVKLVNRDTVKFLARWGRGRRTRPGAHRRGRAARHRRLEGARPGCQRRRHRPAVRVGGLASFGEPGVDRVLEILDTEFSTIMRQAGATSIAQITKESVSRA